MPTTLGNLMKRRGAGLLRHAVAERTDRGEIDDAAVVIKIPGREEIRCSAIIGKLKPAGEGGRARDEVARYDVTANIKSSVLADVAKPLTDRVTVNIPKFAKKEFAAEFFVDHDQTEYGDVMTDLVLYVDTIVEFDTESGF